MSKSERFLHMLMNKEEVDMDVWLFDTPEKPRTHREAVLLGKELQQITKDLNIETYFNPKEEGQAVTLELPKDSMNIHIINNRYDKKEEGNY